MCHAALFAAHYGTVAGKARCNSLAPLTAYITHQSAVPAGAAAAKIMGDNVRNDNKFHSITISTQRRINRVERGTRMQNNESNPRSHWALLRNPAGAECERADGGADRAG